MFYSHQLLSRKAPLGQIWIAATMHAKINKKRINQIDIVEICEQILNPAVPLALRLSGILMGGVVIIFNRKVKFLYDDATRLMLQIKKDITKISIAGADATLLPKGKSQAKFESVTITYGIDPMQDVEQSMLQHIQHPHISMEEFFIVPEEEAVVSQRTMLFQADPEDITLPENNFTFEDRRHEEMHRFDAEDRLPPEAEADENILPPYHMNIDLEQQDEEIPPPNATDFQQPMEEEAQAEAQTQAGADQDAQSVQAVPATRPAKRRRRRGASVIIDDDFTVIPPREFQTWLQDPSDILKRHGRSYERKSGNRNHYTIVEKLLNFQSISFLSQSNKFVGEPSCATPLLWNQSILGRQKIQEGPASRKRRASNLPHDDKDQPTVFEAEPEVEVEAEAPPNINEYDGLVPPEASEAGEQMMSIEKLRARLATPSEQQPPQSDLDLFNHLGLTPTMASGQSMKSRITPASDGLLPSLKENEVPPLRRSKRRKSNTPKELSGNPPGEEDILQAGTPQFGVNSAENIKISQFELMEETGHSQPLHQTPRHSMDDLTTRLLMYFQDHFNTPGVPPKQSLNQLAQGMDRRQAARLFYQTCVLASNNYMRVDQEEPYGDIKIQRGPYL